MGAIGIWGHKNLEPTQISFNWRIQTQRATLELRTPLTTLSEMIFSNNRSDTV
ncbi:hypothetical protein CCP3SC1_100039 [Gammaproteobacteria bacterium]